MNDLVVVGGGFWGTAIARTASMLGARAVIVDNDTIGGASRAASGYYARSWFKGAWAERIRAAEELAARAGAKFEFTGADFVPDASGKVRTRKDWAVFNPAAVLALHADRVVGNVVRVERGRVHLRDGNTVEGRLVVLAVGAWTDRILAASKLPLANVHALGGRGFLISAPPDALVRTLLVPVNPYHNYAVRPWGPGVLRFGETVETVLARDYAKKLRIAVMPHLTPKLGAGCVETGERWGLRPVLKEPMVSEVAPGIIVATGGGRVGGMLAWWAASEVARRLS